MHSPWYAQPSSTNSLFVYFIFLTDQECSEWKDWRGGQIRIGYICIRHRKKWEGQKTQDWKGKTDWPILAATFSNIMLFPISHPLNERIEDDRWEFHMTPKEMRRPRHTNIVSFLFPFKNMDILLSMTI